MDFDLAPPFPFHSSFSTFTPSYSSSTNSLVATFNFANSLFLLDGSLPNDGKVMFRKMSKSDVNVRFDELPNESKASMTGERAPRSERKSCPRPAMPMESRLEQGKRRGGIGRDILRYVIHPDFRKQVVSENHSAFRRIPNQPFLNVDPSFGLHI